MSQPQGSSGGRASVAEFRSDLLGRLGLGDSAGDQDIEGAYRDVLDFLDTAPAGLSGWADSQRDDVDRAFALLAGPEDALAEASNEAALASAAPAAAPVPQPTRPAVTAAAAPVPAGSRGLGRRQLVWILAPVLGVALVLGVYFMGRTGSSMPGVAGTTPSSTQTGADPAQVAALMQKIAANPKDITSLQALGDQYFQAGDYKTASDWEKKVLAVDAKNQAALLALGAAQFNLGNPAEAQKQWLVAVKLYPSNAEVHYDLGFLYMSQTPPDNAKMKAEWQKVIDIDPNSALAKTVATHLASSTPTPSPSN